MSEEQEKGYVEVEPEVTALLRRASELAVRNSAPRIALREVLEALLFRPMTPALIQKLIRAAALAQDLNSNAIRDEHLLQAMIEDPNSFTSQILEQTNGNLVQFREAVASFCQSE